MQTTINNLIINLLSQENLFIANSIRLEELQTSIQATYKELSSANAEDSVYSLVRGLAAKYDVLL